MTKIDWQTRVGEIHHNTKEITEYCGMYHAPSGGSKATFKWKCLRCLKEHGPSQYQDIKRFPTAHCCSKQSKYGKARWGFRHITGEYMRSLHSSAKRRGLEYDITADYLYEVWISQDGRCAYTGLPLKIGSGLSSVDRINPGLGYVIGNVQWVLTKVNMMKWDSTEDEFLTLCSLIAGRNGEKDVNKYLDDEGYFQALSP